MARTDADGGARPRLTRWGVVLLLLPLAYGAAAAAVWLWLTQAEARRCAHDGETMVTAAVDGLTAQWRDALSQARACLQVAAAGLDGEGPCAAAQRRTLHDLAGEDVAQPLRDGSREAVGAAWRDPHSGQVMFRLARRVGADGAAVTMVPTSRFHPSFPGQAGLLSFGINLQNGAMLVRFPLPPGPLPAGAEGPEPATGGPVHDGLYRSATADGGERLTAYRTVADPDVVIWASLDASALATSGRWLGWGLGAGLLAGGAVVAAACMALLRLKRAHERLVESSARAQQELMRSNADLEQFAYAVSHDLKEPLRNIASYVQLLQRHYEGRLDGEADTFIRYTIDGVRRMQRIISDLLAYSRIGAAPPETALPVAAGVAVSAALGALKTAIAEAQAVIEVQGKLPLVAVETGHLTSLFQNLIGNAVKYRRPDIRPEVRIGHDDGGAVWEFFVQDNGQGIAPEHRETVFEVFRRLHPRDSEGGSGIGLAICKRIVERHGGRIWVDAAPGAGTTIRFTLPKPPA